MTTENSTKATLTDEQLEEFLAEIQEVNSLPEEEAQAIRNNFAWGFSDADLAELTEGRKDVLVNSYGKAIKAVSLKEAADAARKRNAKLKVSNKELIKAIKEEALHDPKIDLYSPLEVRHKRIIIKLRTYKYRVMLEAHKKSIATDAYIAIRPLIPQSLLSAAKHYPESVVQAPPFKWQTFDNTQEYTVEFQNVVPLYFKPEVNIQTLIIENNEKAASRIDANIHRFCRTSNALVELELNLAKQLAPMSNFYKLLAKKPLWYKELTDKLKEEL